MVIWVSYDGIQFFTWMSVVGHLPYLHINQVKLTLAVIRQNGGTRKISEQGNWGG